MAGVKISELPAATIPLSGSELLAVVQSGVTKQASADAVSDTVLAEFSDSSGSSLVGFLQSGTGASSRTVQSKLRDAVSVKDFGAVGDGVADDTTAVANAVSYAFTTNKWLYWDGTFKVTTSIANLHDVRSFGSGSLVRGSNTWRVSPTESTTLNLYVDPVGSDTNDGITAALPLGTIQKAYNVIKDRAPLTGRYVINLAAGTYTENIVVSSATESDFPIDLRGPTAGHPNVPTAVIAASDTAGEILAFSEGGWFRLYDIRFTGATTGTAVSVNRSRASLTNVHIDGCLVGAVVQHCGFLGVFGGIWTGRGKAVAGGVGVATYYNSTHSIEVAAAGDAVEITNFERGLLINEGAQGHLDYTKVSDCGTGMMIQRGAGANNTDAMDFKRCDVAIDARNLWFNNGITFGTGADANTVNVRTSGGSPEFDFRNNDSVSKTSRQQVQTILGAHTGTTAETQVWAWTDLRSWMVSEAGDFIDLQAFLETASASLGTIRFRLTIFDGTTDDLLTDITLPIGTTQADVRATVYFSNSNAQRCSISAIHNAGVLVAYGTGALDFKNKTGQLRLKYTLSNAADSVSTRFLRMSTTLGG